MLERVAQSDGQTRTKDTPAAQAHVLVSASFLAFCALFTASKAASLS